MRTVYADFCPRSSAFLCSNVCSIAGRLRESGGVAAMFGEASGAGSGVVWKKVSIASLIEAALCLDVEPSELLKILPLRGVDHLSGVEAKPQCERDQLLRVDRTRPVQ